MISQSAQPDPIDQLLTKITADVRREEEQMLASFLQRAIARTIDTAIIVGVAYGLQELAIRVIAGDNPYNVEFITSSLRQVTPAFGLMLWVLLYSPVMESTGGTIGKRIAGIRLVDLNTRKQPMFRMCAARSWIYLIFVVLAGIPAILSCFAYFISDYHQTWHDKLTNMICVRNNK
ncbi:MAG: RDD family protein [Chitinophagales bacterium]|nr:RDD family protein [Chitinophagales bacterium]